MKQISNPLEFYKYLEQDIPMEKKSKINSLVEPVIYLIAKIYFITLTIFCMSAYLFIIYPITLISKLLKFLDEQISWFFNNGAEMWIDMVPGNIRDWRWRKYKISQRTANGASPTVSSEDGLKRDEETEGAIREASDYVYGKIIPFQTMPYQ